MLANHDKWLALAKKTSPPPSSQPPSQLSSQLLSTLPKLPTTPTNQFKPKKEPTPSKPKEADIKPFDIADIYSQIHNEKRLKEQQVSITKAINSETNMLSRNARNKRNGKEWKRHA